MSNAPTPRERRGGPPGEPRVTCAAAGRATTTATAIAAAARIGFAIADSFTGIPTAAPVKTRTHIRRDHPGGKRNRSATAYELLSPALQTLDRQHELLADSRLHRRMSGVGNDDVIRLGPGA